MGTARGNKCHDGGDVHLSQHGKAYWLTRWLPKYDLEHDQLNGHSLRRRWWRVGNVGYRNYTDSFNGRRYSKHYNRPGEHLSRWLPIANRLEHVQFERRGDSARHHIRAHTSELAADLYGNADRRHSSSSNGSRVVVRL